MSRLDEPLDERLDELEQMLMNTEDADYDPSHLSGWVELLASELNVNDNDPNFHDDSGLAVIPGEAVTQAPPPPPPLVDTQDPGVLLVHMLRACAQAVQDQLLDLADMQLHDIRILAASQPDPFRKVSTYFADALARRIHPENVPEQVSYPSHTPLETHFSAVCPFLWLAHAASMQAIMDALSGSSRIHILDFGLKDVTEWRAFLLCLSLFPDGAPRFRLTAIGPSKPYLEEVGDKLSREAGVMGVSFQFQCFAADSLANIDPEMLGILPSEDESLAVNLVFELHRLFSQPGEFEKVLDLIKAMRPRIVIVVEQEANHNGPVFVDRFNEALAYYSTMFDSLKICASTEGTEPENVLMSEVYLGRQILNVVACEGVERVERHETLDQWRRRMCSAGFNPVHLKPKTFQGARNLLWMFTAMDTDGFGHVVLEDEGCSMVGWKSRPLVTTSVWKLAESEV